MNGNTKIGEPSLKPDPDRAPIIRTVFQLVASGHSSADALRKATSLGLRTRNSRTVAPQTFSAMLRNPVYAGVFDAKGFGLSGVKGDFEPVVPESLFRRVQVVLAAPSATPHDLNNPEFPLRRFVACAVCATPLTGSAPKGRSKRYAYYHCRVCKGISVRKEQLEARFVALLEATVTSGNNR